MLGGTGKCQFIVQDFSLPCAASRRRTVFALLTCLTTRQGYKKTRKWHFSAPSGQRPRVRALGSEPSGINPPGGKSGRRSYGSGGVNMKKTIQFIVITCLVSWAVAGTAILLGLRIENMVAYTIFGAAYMFSPAVCAIVLQIIHKERPFRELGVSFRLNPWFIVAGITPIIYTYLTLGINLLLPNVSFSATADGFLASLPAELAESAAQQIAQFPPAVFMLMQTVNALIAGYTINALFAFGEELGWRGYLLREMKGKKFLHVSLVMGVVWGLWHFPLILLGHNYPENSVAGVGMMVVWCVLLSPVMTYITIKSKSVVTAAVFHGSVNAIGGICGLYLVGGNDLTNGVTGVAGFIALLLVNLAFLLYDKHVTKECVFFSKVGMDAQ